MRLNPAHFNRHLSHMGQTVFWRRAHACPCVNPHSGAANPVCPTCHGKGFFWDQAQSGDVGFAALRVQQSWAQFGRWEAGDVVLTIPSNSPVYAIGRFDRVTLAQGSVPYTVVVMPGQTLKFPVQTVDRAVVLEEGHARDVALPAVTAAGGVTWSEVPAVTVSLSGRRAPEYFCFTDFPNDRGFHHGAALPRRVVMRKFDLFGR